MEELTYEDKQHQLNEVFKKELQELLNKYNAQIYAKDEYMGYPECGEDIHIYIEGKATPDYEPFLMVDLGGGF